MNLHIRTGRSNCNSKNRKNGSAIKKAKPETSTPVATVQKRIMDLISDIRINLDKNGKVLVTRQSQKPIAVGYVDHDIKHASATIKENDITVIIDAHLCENHNKGAKSKIRNLNIKITINANDAFKPTEICVNCYVTNSTGKKQKLQSIDLQKNCNPYSGILIITIQDVQYNITYSFGCLKNR